MLVLRKVAALACLTLIAAIGPVASAGSAPRPGSGAAAVAGSWVSAAEPVGTKRAKAAASLNLKEVLVLNSYHQGYKWGDDIMEGIASVLGPDARNVALQTEYMDTQRISDSRYLDQLYEAYRFKFRDRKFDVIIASDDPAFKFLLQHRDQLFPGTPLVFCGVNYFEDAMLAGHDNVTGVVEAQDIRTTLETALKLHPRTKTIYVVNDRTITGRAIGKALDEVTPLFADRVKFISLAGATMEQIQYKVARLPSQSLVLYLILFEDAAGHKFTADRSISLISEHSSAPIYGVWDFSLGHGIVGGMLISGFYQGQMAATAAKRILAGEKATRIPIVRKSPNHYMFDSIQMKRFGIKSSDVPQESIIINDTHSGKKQILVLNSYHYGMPWTDSIVSGVKSVLGDKSSIDLHIEFMDTKRNIGPEYVQKLYQMYKYEFRNRHFDAIITSDDDAYNLVMKYHQELFPKVPVVFCGVNYFQPSDLKEDKLVTGVVEAVDIKKTLEVALKLHAGVKRIVVINDMTSTGIANRKLVDAVVPDFPALKFVFYDDMNMAEVQERVAKLSADSLILLLSFNKDKSNNTFSYEESILKIAGKAAVPLYGVWDFYVGQGIVGGLVTSGYSQGEMAARMVERILAGELPESIPVMTASPNRYMFDYHYLTRFAIDQTKLPESSIVVNKPQTAAEKYLIPALAGLLGLALVLIVYQRKKAADQLKLMAHTDPMTGLLNRRSGLALLNHQVESANYLHTMLTICFVDVDGLKMVNDNLGHPAGDSLIREASQLLQQCLRKGDLVCRFGGDEFVLAFTGCNLEQARQIWDKIEGRMALLNETGNRDFRLSMSRGFAEYDPAAPVAVVELIKAADSKMYDYKQRRKAEAGGLHSRRSIAGEDGPEQTG